MTRFTDYATAAGTGGIELVWRHELIDAGGVVLATTEDGAASGAIRWAAEIDPLDVRADRLSQQSSTLVLPVEDPSALVPGTRSGDLHPDSRRRVRSSAGIVTATGTVWWQQSTLLVDRVEAVDDGGVVSLAVELVDAVNPLRSELATAFSWDDGEPIETVVARALDTVLDDADYTLPTTGCTLLAGDAEPGADLFGLVSGLLEACGLELIASRAGIVTARAILPSDDDPVSDRWVYGDGGIPIDTARRSWSARRWRGWRVEGGAPQQDTAPVVATVYDLDTRSEGYFAGLGDPAQLGESRYPHVADLTVLQDAGYAQLRRRGAGPGIVRFATVPNPAMRQGDLVHLSAPNLGVDGAHRVTAFQLPLQADGLMVVEARGAWEPDAGYLRPGIEVDPSCVTSFADSFDREDQDLQVIAGGAGGSAVWTEIGPSWYIQSNRAVQWYAGGWSLAFVNQALCSSRQYAEIILGDIPSGRRVGPACRCNGALAAYVALVDSAAVLSLEVWLNGQSVAVLGTYAMGGSPFGRLVRVQADGSTVAATVDGTEVLSTTDSRLVGRHVGMLGYGGGGSQAPQVQSFSAAALA